MFDWRLTQHINCKSGISARQGEKLYELALSCIGNAVEIGSLRGRSTSIIATGLKNGHGGKLFAIDIWQWNPISVEFDVFKKNVEDAGCWEKIIPIHNYSFEVWNKKEPKELFASPIGMLFIDGNHSYESVKKDLNWVKLVKPGGMVAFHDYGGDRIVEVKQAVDEFVETNPGVLKQIGIVQTMIIFEKL